MTIDFIWVYYYFGAFLLASAAVLLAGLFLVREIILGIRAFTARSSPGSHGVPWPGKGGGHSWGRA